MNRKEKNLIVVDNPNGKGEYKLDINTGIVYGLRDKPIKTISGQLIDCFYETVKGTELALAIQTIVLNKRDCLSNTLKDFCKVLQTADSLDNLGLSTNYYYYNYPVMIMKLISEMNFIKEYSNFVKIQKNNHVINYNLQDFNKWYTLQKLYKKFNTMINVNFYLSIDNINYLLNLDKRSTQSFKVNFIDNGLFNAIDDLDMQSTFIAKFQNYITWCNYLNEKVTTKDNFWKEYKRIKKAYTAQKELIDKEQFIKAINMHKNEMEFEFGDYQVVIPKEPDDIKREGMSMHHCVASYAKDCINFSNPYRSYIVFIRNKNDLNKCYITCEICNGKIGQYYLAYDKPITKEEDLIFKQKYQEHLNKCWIKE